MTRFSLFAALIVCGTGFSQKAQAVDWYVATNGTGSGTGGWADATNSLQGAIDDCEKSNTVWVSNGVYRTGAILYALDNNVTSNRIAIWKPLTVRSLNDDPAQTVIEGGGVEANSNAVRCVAMTNGAALIGFTLSGGRTRGAAATCPGAGVLCLSTDTVISNCIMTDCRANNLGGFGFGGGAYKGTLYGCILTNGNALYGGGAYLSILYNCTVVKNSGGNGAGGMNLCTAYNCLIKGNTGGPIGGGGALDSTLYNCLVVNNTAEYGGGARFGKTTPGGNIYNCTVVGNTATKRGGGICPGYLYTNSAAYNSIICFNTAPTGANWEEGMVASNSCTFPAISGAGNITGDPLFVNTNAATSDYHLKAGSPCINTGTNGVWTTGVDLDGYRRRMDGTVDMGCYEYFRRGTLCVFW